MILEAAKSIMTASSALVRAANAAQRELIDQGKVSRTPHISSDDGQWSEGLISAARLVAAAAHSLVEAAQNLVQGCGTEEGEFSSNETIIFFFYNLSIIYNWALTLTKPFVFLRTFF